MLKKSHKEYLFPNVEVISIGGYVCKSHLDFLLVVVNLPGYMNMHSTPLSWFLWRQTEKLCSHLSKHYYRTMLGASDKIIFKFN